MWDSACTYGTDKFRSLFNEPSPLGFNTDHEARYVVKENNRIATRVKQCVSILTIGNRLVDLPLITQPNEVSGFIRLVWKYDRVLVRNYTRQMP